MQEVNLKKINFQIDANTSFLDLLLRGTNQGFEHIIYGQPTNYMLIHSTSDHLTEHKTADFRFLLIRKHQPPLNPRN